MFEVIISSVRTGRVFRKLFDSRDEVDHHVDQFMEGPNREPRKPRNRRDYRVEVFFRNVPEVRALRSMKPAKASPSFVPAA
jgi:hypothetical protein